MKQKKILHVISGDLWAGAEVQAFTLLKQLKLTHDIYVVLMNDGELANQLRGVKIDVTILDESNISSAGVFFRLISILKGLKPNIIHTHRQKENILASLANLFSVRVRCIRTQHGAYEFKGNWKTKIQRLIDKLVGRYLQQAIIAVSTDLKLKLVHDFPVNMIHVVENGVDVKMLMDATYLVDFKLAEPEIKHIGIIGRLVKVKRVDIFLEIASLAIKRGENFQFHIIGDGPMLGELKSRAKQLKLDGSVIFHGHRTDIPACIYSLDVVVMCSDHEGMPMVALETIALSTALITRNIPPFNHFSEVIRVENRAPYQENFLNVICSHLLTSQPLDPFKFKHTALAMAEKTSHLYGFS